MELHSDVRRVVHLQANYYVQKSSDSEYKIIVENALIRSAEFFVEEVILQVKFILIHFIHEWCSPLHFA